MYKRNKGLEYIVFGLGAYVGLLLHYWTMQLSQGSTPNWLSLVVVISCIILTVLLINIVQDI